MLAVLAWLLPPAASDARDEAGRTRPIAVLADGRALATAATLDKALGLVRDHRRTHPAAAIAVELPAGIFRIRSPIAIGPAESGTGNGSLAIRGAPGGGTVISGSVGIGPLPATAPVIDPAAVAGLATPVLTYRSYREPKVDAEPLVFSGGEHLRLPQWPAQGYRTGWTMTVRPDGTLVSHPDFAEAPGATVRVMGFITADWAYEAIPGRTVAGGVFLPGYRPSSAPQARLRLAVANVAASGPGRHYRIGNGATLALSGLPTGSSVEVAVAGGLLAVERASNLTIADIAFEHSVGDAIRIYVSSHVTITDCYVGGAGGKGISVDGGDHVTIDRCVIDDTGHSGITLFGGDRASLAGSAHLVRDSVIQRSSRRVRAYTPGVALLGVGNRLSHSMIQGLPHAAVGLSGNDNVVEDSEVRAVACETGDVGAIYMGRDWTQRGNRITGNFLHDIGTGDPSLGNSAVYLDDQFSGALIADNVILRSSQGVVIGGGRDNLVMGNVFAAMTLSALWLDQRGLGAQQADARPDGWLYRQLVESPFRSALWRGRYPSLAALPDNRPGAAVGNRADGNVFAGIDFLQTDPLGLPLAGTGNKRAPDRIVGALAGLPAKRQYLLLRTLLPIPARSPGPAAPLLFASRAAAIDDCRESSD